MFVLHSLCVQQCQRAEAVLMPEARANRTKQDGVWTSVVPPFATVEMTPQVPPWTPLALGRDALREDCGGQLQVRFEGIR